MKQIVEKCLEESKKSVENIKELRGCLNRIQEAYANIRKYVEENYETNEKQKTNVIKSKASK